MRFRTTQSTEVKINALVESVSSEVEPASGPRVGVSLRCSFRHCAVRLNDRQPYSTVKSRQPPKGREIFNI